MSFPDTSMVPFPLFPVPKSQRLLLNSFLLGMNVSTCLSPRVMEPSSFAKTSMASASWLSPLFSYPMAYSLPFISATMA